MSADSHHDHSAPPSAGFGGDKWSNKTETTMTTKQNIAELQAIYNQDGINALLDAMESTEYDTLLAICRMIAPDRDWTEGGDDYAPVPDGSRMESVIVEWIKRQ